MLQKLFECGVLTVFALHPKQQMMQMKQHLHHLHRKCRESNAVFHKPNLAVRRPCFVILTKHTD